MKHYPANRKHTQNIPLNSKPEVFAPEILADSLEVMESYCVQKIVLLQSSLEKLNVADNAREIIGICQQIKKEKKLLTQIISRKKLETGRNN
ncbi:hypothetical protein LZZ85_06635 [Terrimonas sp. NA20]|uniref:Uncharacterized protein n=1 Tax=Terrimonas ginsenosidimutans TaxID=2908004 RepID=A0ABS9KNT0_9BACT|nr:hypothetical protein [Terrimonas ginsenosidimutans]MCG2613949.1 hypothetical protein [Terrimonas ginsenosidimutans]